MKIKISIIGLICMQFAFSQTIEERAEISKSYNQDKIKELKQKIHVRDSLRLIRSADYINKYGKQLKNNNGHLEQFQYIAEDGTPVFYRTYNNAEGFTTRSKKLYSGGTLGLNVQGQNMIAGVWDGGAVLLTHSHFQNRVIQLDNSGADLSDHSTHVTGTICQNKLVAPLSKGMAFNSSVWANDWTNDTDEVLTAAGNGLLISNHSYGLAVFNNAGNLQVPLYVFGAYSQDSKDWDDIMFNNPYYLYVGAAGNDRDSAASASNKGGYDLITGDKIAKNGIVVGAVENQTNFTSPSFTVMSTFSNWGPCDDGRIKPDIVGPGVDVQSTMSTGDNVVGTMSGTSMASPAVTGTLLLYQQHYKNVFGNFMKAATLKGLALHTADEAGTDLGPDYRFGWGLVNAEKAAKLITAANSTSIIKELSLQNGQTISMTLAPVDTSLPIIASISWTDPSGTVRAAVVDLATPALVNDLDIRLVKDQTTYMPWKLSVANPSQAATQGDNLVDPFERIDIYNPSGTYTLTISHKGTLINNHQDFTLIASNINAPLSTFNPLTPENNVAIYPNPASDVINILTDVAFGIEKVEILEINGKVVLSEQAKNLENNSISISQLQNGVYFVKTYGTTSSSVKKFIKK
jgi:subtilisin family serine protease